MKDLNRNEVYDLRGITHEQAVELLEWLKVNDTGWNDSNLSCIKSDKSLYFNSGEWLINFSTEINFKYTTHIKNLFTTELEDLIKQRDELNKQIDEYGKPKVGDVCKFWDDGTDWFVVGVLTELSDSEFSFKNEIAWYRKAKKLTEQEVIELLFKK